MSTSNLLLLKPTLVGLGCFIISLADTAMGRLDRDAGRDGLALEDTGEQDMVPTLGCHRYMAASSWLAKVSVAFWSFGRRPFWEAQAPVAQCLANVEKSGDTGGYGKKFGKNWGDKIPDLVAIDGYEHHKQNEFGGRRPCE